MGKGAAPVAQHWSINIEEKKIHESVSNSKAVQSLHVIQFYFLKTAFKFE